MLSRVHWDAFASDLDGQVSGCCAYGLNFAWYPVMKAGFAWGTSHLPKVVPVGRSNQSPVQQDFKPPDKKVMLHSLAACMLPKAWIDKAEHSQSSAGSQMCRDTTIDSNGFYPVMISFADCWKEKCQLQGLVVAPLHRAVNNFHVEEELSYWKLVKRVFIEDKEHYEAAEFGAHEVVQQKQQHYGAYGTYCYGIS